MSISLLAAAFVATVLGTGSGGLCWRWGVRRGADAVHDATDRQVEAMGAQRDAAERRAREAQAESGRWKGMSLAGAALSSRPVFADRPAPRDAEELARLVRGITFVDDVVLADRSGYPLTRETDASTADLAALAPHVLQLSRRLALGALPLVALDLETFAASHIHARLLTGRAEGAVVLVRTTSQKANPLALDAIAHAAVRDLTELPLGLASRSGSGSTDRQALEGASLGEAVATLERELMGHLTGVVLVLDDRPIFSAANDGPDASTRASVAAALGQLAARATKTLRATSMARIEVALRGGLTASWSAVAHRSRLAVITFGRADTRSSARLDLLLGKLRRSLDSGTGSALFEESAA